MIDDHNELITTQWASVLSRYSLHRRSWVTMSFKSFPDSRWGENEWQWTTNYPIGFKSFPDSLYGRNSPLESVFVLASLNLESLEDWRFQTKGIRPASRCGYSPCYRLIELVALIIFLLEGCLTRSQANCLAWMAEFMCMPLKVLIKCLKTACNCTENLAAWNCIGQTKSEQRRFKSVESTVTDSPANS